MNSKLVQRTITTLTWMTEEMKRRFDEIKDSMGKGHTGGYSPEIEEAMLILRDLRNLQQELALESPLLYHFAERTCKDMAIMVGGTEQDGMAFYLQYAPQGFRWGNGLPITDLSGAMRKWIVKSYERDGEPPSHRMTCTGPTPRQLDTEARGK